MHLIPRTGVSMWQPVCFSSVLHDGKHVFSVPICKSLKSLQVAQALARSAKISILPTFSDGCGPTHGDRAYVYIAEEHEEVLLSVVNSEAGTAVGTARFALDRWQLVSEEVCQDCEECDAGWFNDGCNDYNVLSVDNIAGKGECNICLDNCVNSGVDSTYSYLYHPDQIKGCDPPTNSSKRSVVDPNKVRVTANYECKSCAASVFVDDSRLYDVVC